ncbi:unnamed protein product [Peniophora sp. CBMAI 1063]|nr:unnamed protein product [Peniophora sp. CBMAI 1063]
MPTSDTAAALWTREPGKKSDQEDGFLDAYVESASTEDEARPRHWDQSMSNLLIFIGLFSATVAPFLTDSYNDVLPDSLDESLLVQIQILETLQNQSNTAAPALPLIQPFTPSPLSVGSGTLWFFSLSTSLSAALLATLIQQWSRAYMRQNSQHKAEPSRDRTGIYNLIFTRIAAESYHMDQLVFIAFSLTHVAVFTFIAGLLIQLWGVNNVFTAAMLIYFGTLTAAYVLFSALPILSLDKNLPYVTPLTYVHAMFIYSCICLIPRSFPMLRWTRPWYLDEVSTTCRSLAIDCMTAQWWETPYVKSDGTGYWNRVSHFSFAWEHTKPRMITEGKLGALLSSALHTLVQPGPARNTLKCLNQLASDQELVRALYARCHSLAHGGAADDGGHTAFLQTVCVLMNALMTTEIEKTVTYGSINNNALGYFIELLFALIRHGASDRRDAQWSLRARLYIFYLRSALWWHCRRASKRELRQPDPIPPLDNHEVLYVQNMHPETLLIMLSTPMYNGGDSASETPFDLIPLHDDACCRAGKIPEHFEACNLLTLIAHILSASEVDASAVLDDPLTQRFYRLMQNRNDVQNSYLDVEARETTPSMCAPSEAFKATLRRAGLQTWLEDQDGSFARPDDLLLNSPVLTRTLRDKSDEGIEIVFTVLHLLRSLARLTTMRHVTVSQVEPGMSQDANIVSRPRTIQSPARPALDDPEAQISSPATGDYAEASAHQQVTVLEGHAPDTSDEDHPGAPPRGARISVLKVGKVAAAFCGKMTRDRLEREVAKVRDQENPVFVDVQGRSNGGGDQVRRVATVLGPVPDAMAGN